MKVSNSAVKIISLNCTYDNIYMLKKDSYAIAFDKSMLFQRSLKSANHQIFINQGTIRNIYGSNKTYFIYFAFGFAEMKNVEKIYTENNQNEMIKY